MTQYHVSQTPPTAIKDSLTEMREDLLWKGIRKRIDDHDEWQVDTSGVGFGDVVREGIHRAHEINLAPSEMYLWVHPETQVYIREWHDRMSRLTPYDMEWEEQTPTHIEINGIEFTIVADDHVGKNEMIMSEHGLARATRFVVVEGLPIGVEITLWIDGEDNTLEVEN